MLAPAVRKGLTLAGLGLILATLPACRGRALQSCRELVESGRYEEAAARCEQVYTENDIPEAGALAARAQYGLRHGDQVLAWADRLKGSRGEAGALALAGLIYQQRGETDLAVQACRRSLDLARAAGDHARSASAFYCFFQLSWYSSRYREGLDSVRQGYEEAVLANDRVLQASAAESLYTILHTIGDQEGARRALDRADELLPESRKTDRIRILANRGNLRIDDGRLELARRDIERALELAGESATPRFYRSTHLNLFDIALKQGDLDRAEHHIAEVAKHIEPEGQGRTAFLYFRSRLERARGRLEEAERSLRTALAEESAAEWEWELTYELGGVLEARGDLQAAEASYARAVEIVEEMRAELGLDNAKDWLLENRRAAFESLFRLQAHAGRAEEALATAERVRTRTFQDAFLQAMTTAETSHREVWTAAADRLTAWQELLPAMSESPAAAPRPIRQVLAEMKGRFALVYFGADDELWLLRVADRDIRLYRLAVSQRKAEELAHRFAAQPDDRQTAVALGNLLAPPGALPPSGRTVHIAADGELGRIPFAALRSDEMGGRCWIEEHSVAYIPGVSVLAAIGAGSLHSRGAPVVLADARGDLPAAEAEAREVAARLGGPAWTGKAANARALAAAADARVLHLATHTGVGPAGPWLALSDRRMTAASILAGRLRPRLAVLATCASAVPGGRGMWGSLGSAFLAAGSEDVLAALWSVQDRTAREVVLRFYAEGGADDPVAALARAQRAFLAAGKPPSFWAPFVLLGADRPPRESSPRGEERSSRYAVRKD